MSPIKGEFLASYSKEKFSLFWQKLSIEGPILLAFINSCQIFSEGLLVIHINKVQSFCYN